MKTLKLYLTPTPGLLFLANFTFLFSFFFVPKNMNAQTLINQLWTQTLNYPDTVPWSASVLNSSSDLFTTGNTWHNATQKVNIVTTKTNSSGTIIWQTEYDGTLSGFDYGSAIAIDGSGNIFVAGATHNTSAYTFDIVVIKYNSSGTQQWATLFNGSGSGMDIPSGITLDGSGNIYVCGASTGTSTGYDYVTMKLNSSGVTQWTQTYDYASLSDLPGYIEWSSTNSKIGIAGASQSSASNWDYTIIKYNASGTLTNTNRSSAVGYGFDRPTGLVTDAADNFYVTGYAFNGDDYDFRTIKLDEDLSPIWTVTDDGGSEDGSNGICMDASNNTYVAGFSTGSAGNKLMKIIKYNSSGTQQWEKVIANNSVDIDAEATGLTYNSTSNRILVTGTYVYSTGKKTITSFALDVSDGDIVWKKDFPNVNASIDVSYKIFESGNHIWVLGRRLENDTTRYVTIKYETYEDELDVVLDIEDRPIYMDNEVLIRFNPKYLKYDFIDNTQKTFADLQDAIVDTVYDILEPLINPENEQFTSTAIKIFKNFTSDDTISISRLGDTVKVKKLWSALKVILPESVSPSSLIDTLNNLGDIIYYAHVNGLYSEFDIPGDFYIDDDMQQENLIPSLTFPGADINMDGAWEIEKGKEYIRVGVLDHMIFWANEDFGDGTFTGSKIVDGYDYYNNLNVEEVDNPDNSHGTAAAGIIGAIRNNDIGIAGIAGGNFNVDASTGVSLYSIGVFGMIGLLEQFIPVSVAADAIFEASHFNPGSEVGFGLHIENMSWGGPDEYVLIEDALEQAYHNNCVLVIARGNQGVDDLEFPACYNDDWILNVGASGTDGTYKRTNNGDDFFAGSFGGEVDLIAPGTTEIVPSTINPDAPFGWEAIEVCEDVTEEGYSCFNGSSSAAPHVAGVAALMLSRHNTEQGYPNNLAVEDVEELLQKSAFDVEGTFGGETYDDGYDEFNGWGLLDATATMEILDLPHYMVYHNIEPVSETITPALEQYVFVNAYESGLASGNYFADRYTISRTYLDVFSSTTEILDWWIRWSSTIGVSAANPITGDQFADFEFTIVDNVASVTVTTFAWHVYETATGADVNVWIPAQPADIRTDYSLHLHDPQGDLVSTEEISFSENELIIYPNPSNGIFQIDLNLYTDGIITVYNQLGELCNIGQVEGNSNVMINLEGQPSGIYFVQLTSEEVTYFGKLIKQ